MAYPQITEYNEAVQHPAHAFVDSELKQGKVKENSLGLPLVMSGGFALTYTMTTSRRKCAVRCFHREIPSIEQKYDAISAKLKALRNEHFVDFDFQRAGIRIRQNAFPIVRMDWVEGDPLGVWLDKNFHSSAALETARSRFRALSAFLEREGVAHGDIQNGNVMMPNGVVKLIDYDGMYVPGLPLGKGSETGHKHFQHPDRGASDYGPKMDRFSFIAVDLSLQALKEENALYKQFREGGETIIFKANDFAEPQNSEIFRRLLSIRKLEQHTKNFASICDAAINLVPTLDDFLVGKNIPVARARVAAAPAANAASRSLGYISAFPVLDALDFAAATRHIGDKIELVGQIVEIKPGVGKRGKGRDKPYIFINFGPWRGSIVKISIWSEGLAKLKEEPSNAWLGRWVSVTGLIDPPYVSKRYGYTHLSITVSEEGQIQVVGEAQARFRLASIGKAPPHRNRATPDSADSSTAPKTTTPRLSPKGGNGVRTKTATKNQQILNKYKTPSVPTPSAPGKSSTSHASTPPAQRGTPRPPTKSSGLAGLLESIPGWLWVVAIVVVLYLVFRKP